MRSFFQSSILTATLAATVTAAPSFANPTINFNILATDQDVYPANYPYNYNAVQTLVLDMTSSVYIPQPWLQFEFPDILAERQFNSFRSIMREMYDLQTLSSPTIRTRDLPSSYTMALSDFCGYYLVTGAVYPVGGIPNAAACNPPTPVVVVAPEPVAPAPAPVFVRPAPPVPALW